MPKTSQIAKPGDIFLLLVPTGKDLINLRQKNKELLQLYGGQLVEPIHITVERFSPAEGQFPSECIHKIQHKLQGIQPFQLYADALIQFFAPYWQSPVLRWRVKKSTEWENFRNLLVSTLRAAGCPSHFIRRRHASCTILKLEKKIALPDHASKVSQPLFTLREIWISQLTINQEFKILEKMEIGKQPL